MNTTIDKKEIDFFSELSDEWWNEKSPKFGDFWKKVEHYRQNGYNELLKKSKKYNKPSVKCLIMDSDDD